MSSRHAELRVRCPQTFAGRRQHNPVWPAAFKRLFVQLYFNPATIPDVTNPNFARLRFQHALRCRQAAHLMAGVAKASAKRRARLPGPPQSTTRSVKARA